MTKPLNQRMAYVIVNFNEETKKYDVLSWSHRYDDIVKQYVRLKVASPQCEVMINIKDISREEFRISIKAQAKELLENV